MDLRYVFAAVLWLAVLIGHPAAWAQNQPVSGLTPRGTPQGTDLIPILPVGAPRLLSVTVSQLQGFVGGGTVTSVTCGAGLTGGTFTVSGTCALANPSATTLGGIESAAAITHEWINAISTSGVPSQTRPACADLSDATYCNVSLTNGITLANIAQAGANTVLGNFTGSTANLAANAMPNCPDSGGNHLNYVSGTGLSCGTTANVAPLIGTGGTFYVNHSTGSDSNPCTSSGAPCLTINHAISLVPPLITGLYTINIADGTYAECPKTANINSSVVNGAMLAIVGDVSTPTNVVITGTCTVTTGVGSETTSIQLNAAAPTSVSGIKTAPGSTVTYGIFVGQSLSATFSALTVSNATSGLGAFYSTVVFGGTTTFTGWTNKGIFLGLNSIMTTAASSGVVINLTPATLGGACIHTEIGAHADLEGPANSIVCPGGSNNVTHVAEADLHSGIWSALAWTAVNASTPGSSAVVAATRGSNVYLDATSSHITATNFTNSCFGWEAAAGDIGGGSGSRTFTSVGTTSLGDGGSCLVF
jgi:hypothetical protein